MTTITVSELKSRIDAGEKVNLLDVREDIERADFNIGGKHVPVGKIQTMQVEDIEEWKDEEILVYCRSGQRSQMSCLILNHMGFKNTVNVTGGMLAWEAAFGRK